jgi:outer membrane immunogenic protein
VNSGCALVETFPYSAKGFEFGYAFGGGAEWALNANWSIKAEYLRVSLPNLPGQTVATTFLGPNALATDIMTFSPSRDNLNIVRVGLNYRFLGL